MRIKVHHLHLKFSIQQQRHAIDTSGKLFPFFGGNLRTLELDRHPVETGMIARDCGFEIGAETTNKEGQMQSTDLEEIKAAQWEQAYHPCTRVSWGAAQVMAIRRSKGKLQEMSEKGRISGCKSLFC
jgi:hypothetical protein